MAKLGQILITSNIISEEQLKQALSLQKKEGGRLGTNLAKLGYITEDKLVSFLSKQFGVPAINLSEYTIDPAVVKLIPLEMARKYLMPAFLISFADAPSRISSLTSSPIGMTS